MCGFTTGEGVKSAVLAGADLIGLNFYAESPRAVGFDLARILATAARHTFNPRRRGHKVQVVAVFVDPPDELVRGVIDEVKPDLLQFHGQESPQWCRSFGHPFLKAHSLRSTADAKAIPDYLGGLGEAYLIDAYSRASRGGTGQLLSPPLVRAGLRYGAGFLAGGLTPDNVGAVVSQFHPFGVDVASGIETRPGMKNPRLMHAFVQAVEAAE
jgi:phosphoribosylanthranilate isomerase